MKIFKITQKYGQHFVCAHHIEEAKEIFSYVWYPIYGDDVLKQSRDEMWDEDSQWKIEEVSIEHPGYLGGWEG